MTEAAQRLRLSPFTIYAGGGGTESLQAAMIRRGRKILLPASAVDNLIIGLINQARRGRDRVTAWIDELITAEEVAVMLSVSPVSVYAGAAGTDGLTRVRLGTRVLWLRSEIEDRR